MLKLYNLSIVRKFLVIQKKKSFVLLTIYHEEFPMGNEKLGALIDLGVIIYTKSEEDTKTKIILKRLLLDW